MVNFIVLWNDVNVSHYFGVVGVVISV